MVLIEFYGTARRIPDEGHVLRSVEALISGPIETSAKPSGVVVVQPCALPLKVQDQPDFEAWIGHRELIVVR